VGAEVLDGVDDEDGDAVVFPTEKVLRVGEGVGAPEGKAVGEDVALGGGKVVLTAVGTAVGSCHP